MKQHLLEIGPRDEPAIYRPGRIFEDEDIVYFSAALDGAPLAEPWENHRSIFRADHGPYEHISTAVIAALGSLPFRDRSFAHVIMKSVLGESWCSVADGSCTPDDSLTLSGRSLNEALSGIDECHRVLEPGGVIAIAEEDTPTKSTIVLDQLKKSGFDNIVLTPYRKSLFIDSYPTRSYVPWFCEGPTPDPEWIRVRSTYWLPTPLYDKWGMEIRSDDTDSARGYARASYIVTANKANTAD